MAKFHLFVAEKINVSSVKANALMTKMKSNINSVGSAKFENLCRGLGKEKTEKPDDQVCILLQFHKYN